MTKHEKTWGWEHWFANNDKYCGKLLFVRQNEWSSKGRYHYHKIKDETFFVVEGGLRLDYYKDNEHHSITLGRYDSFRVPPEMKHRFTAATVEGCYFIEASTTHMEEDSYRCELVNGEWVE
jgi:mannose-6-phosphate isomerase-like protein (cupin superfamily)